MIWKSCSCVRGTLMAEFKDASKITYGSEFWCRFTWSVRWSDRENAREQRLQGKNNDNKESGERWKEKRVSMVNVAKLRMRMATVLETFHWWGRLSYWHQAFHLAFIWQLSGGFNFYDSTLAPTKREHYVSLSVLTFIQSASSRQPFISDHQLNYWFHKVISTPLRDHPSQPIQV